MPIAIAAPASRDCYVVAEDGRRRVRLNKCTKCHLLKKAVQALTWKRTIEYDFSCYVAG
jgi:hypothetical protein